MKQVILNIPLSSTVTVDEVTSEKYIGVQIESQKGFIIQRDKSCRVYCCNSITRGNYFGFFEGYESLTALITRIIKECHSVYVFDTYQELFKWLSE